MCVRSKLVSCEQLAGFSTVGNFNLAAKRTPDVTWGMIEASVSGKSGLS